MYLLQYERSPIEASLNNKCQYTLQNALYPSHWAKLKAEPDWTGDRAGWIDICGEEQVSGVADKKLVKILLGFGIYLAATSRRRSGLQEMKCNA